MGARTPQAESMKSNALITGMMTLLPSTNTTPMSILAGGETGSEDQQMMKSSPIAESIDTATLINED
jgi:hypothetical protein